MNRAQIKIYLYGDKDAQKESVDLEELNKGYKGQDLDNKAYNEFWKDIDGRQRRGSQSVKRSRGGSRGGLPEN